MNQVSTCFPLMPWHSVPEVYKGLMKPGSNPKLFLWKQALAAGKAVNQPLLCCVWDLFGCFQHLAARLPNQLVSQGLALMTQSDPEFLAHLTGNCSFAWEKQARVSLFIFFFFPFSFLFSPTELVSIVFCYVVTHSAPFSLKKKNPQVKKQTNKLKKNLTTTTKSQLQVKQS